MVVYMMTITEAEQRISAQLTSKRISTVGLKSALFGLKDFGIGAITSDYLTALCPTVDSIVLQHKIAQFAKAARLRIERAIVRRTIHAKLLGRIKGKRIPTDTEGYHLGKGNYAQPETVEITQRWIQLQ